MLLPLVDHAIVRGLEPSRAAGTLRIGTEISEGRLRLRIADTGVGFVPETDGDGIADIRERLHALYGGDGSFFLPFVDSLAGKETYPAGRYLEPEQLDGSRFLVDFNLAYNPYCAYNEMWSCPLTPFENRVKVPVRAGEKNFH